MSIESVDNTSRYNPLKKLCNKIAHSFIWEKTTDVLDYVSDESKLSTIITYVTEKQIEPYYHNPQKLVVLNSKIYYFDNLIDNIGSFQLRKKLKGWEIEWTMIWEFIKYHPVLFTDFSWIKSAPTYKSSSTWTTLCSKTAQENGNNFWLKLPDWNAKLGVEKDPIDSRFIETKKAENGSMVDLNEYSKTNKWNFADLSVKSDTTNWKKYGHRAVAFLEKTSWQWYVLDPYYSGGKKRRPQLLSEYSKKDKILQANFYAAEIQPEKEINMI